ncbi:MAG TPA: hypothetical protein VGE69_12720 [Pseudomonadales bacterium]
MRTPRFIIAGALATLASTAAFAQPPGGFQPPPQLSPRESAQVDITGYWVALVTEDWLWRMVTAPKGDVTSIPVNPRGRQVANEWDLEKDNATGEQCRAYGAAGLMRLPTRLHISWQDDNTLRIESDAGEQTRLLQFKPGEAPAEASWQGHSIASWTRATGGFDMRAIFGGAPQQGPIKAGLKVETGHLRPGYLRKNGVPYSEQTALTEYFTTVQAAGHEYLTVMSVVRDPVYLSGPFVTSSQFKKEADDSNWNPRPCATEPPTRAARVPQQAPQGAQ